MEITKKGKSQGGTKTTTCNSLHYDFFVEFITRKDIKEEAGELCKDK